MAERQVLWARSPGLPARCLQAAVQVPAHQHPVQRAWCLLRAVLVGLHHSIPKTAGLAAVKPRAAGLAAAVQVQAQVPPQLQAQAVRCLAVWAHLLVLRQ